jgi:putative acetyltransferase
LRYGDDARSDCFDGLMAGDVETVACDPSSPEARAMSDALWEEIQRRYGFTAPNPFEPGHFTGPVGGFWVAVDSERKPVGSIAVRPLDPPAAELDVMYVAPEHRRAGVARLLLATLESHARSAGVGVLRLRAGEQQSEALRFYTAAGFVPIPPFGKWVGDDTARCFEKLLT